MAGGRRDSTETTAVTSSLVGVKPLKAKSTHGKGSAAKHGLSVWQVLHLLHRLGILLAAILYFVYCVKATVLVVDVLDGIQSPSATKMTDMFGLTRALIGSSTSICESAIVTIGLQNDTTPRNGTLFLEKEGPSFQQCAKLSPGGKAALGNDFQRSIFNAVVRDTSYNLTFLDQLELVAPMVDCSSMTASTGILVAIKFNFIVRSKTDPTDVSVLAVHVVNQEYRVPNQSGSGCAAVATVALVDDLNAPAVDYYHLISLGYPYEELSFSVCNFGGITDDGAWALETIPSDPTRKIRKEICTSMRSGYYLKSETEQSNILNSVYALPSSPVKALTESSQSSRILFRDTWAWVQGVHFFFGIDLLLNLFVLLLVSFRNFQKGKFWIGDAFLSISSKTLAHGAIVVIAWFADSFWALFQVSLDHATELWAPSRVSPHVDVVRADLLCLYLSVCSILGSIFRERVDPLLAIISFEIGLESRNKVLGWFPTVHQYLYEFSVQDILKGIPVPQVGQEKISPMTYYTTHQVEGFPAKFIVQMLLPLILSLVIIVVYIISCKIYRHFFPEKIHVLRHSSNTTGTSGGEDMVLTHKRVLTLFEIATGAALESRFGLMSNYEKYLLVKGLRFATADGIYSNGFVIANQKYVLQTDDYWSIVLIKLSGQQYKHVFVYEITGSTVQQTAKLVYPHTFTFTDLLNLNISVLS